MEKSTSYIYMLFWKNALTKKTKIGSLVKKGSRPAILDDGQWINYTDQNYKRNTFVFAPIFHELNSKIEDIFYVHKRPISLKYFSQICLNLC